MFSIQQLIKALRRLQSNSNIVTCNAADLVSNLENVTSPASTSTAAVAAAKSKTTVQQLMMKSSLSSKETENYDQNKENVNINDEQQQQQQERESDLCEMNTNSSQNFSRAEQENETKITESPITLSSSSSSSVPKSKSNSISISNLSSSAQSTKLRVATTISTTAVTSSSNISVSHNLCSHEDGSCTLLSRDLRKLESKAFQSDFKDLLNLNKNNSRTTTTTIAASSVPFIECRSQRIQNFYQQQLHHFHTQHNQSLYAKQNHTQFAMSSLAAADPVALKQEDLNTGLNGQITNGNHSSNTNGSSCHESESHHETAADASSTTRSKACFNTGLAEILKFMELIGNLKHTKRTGWVLRDVNDCESISGHMYRMSMMTFLLDGTEGLNQIRCMELALVHDLAESLVGDITPFCGISKEEKRAMEFKAMEDICKLIEPRGKRIWELFEEYENGESAESRFVKDLDRLDMVMQAFEYEKRDNCLLKHQEFFDSTEGKFNHPFVKKLVGEIYEQRKSLARAKGATPPPRIEVPDMDSPSGESKCQKNSPKASNDHKSS